MSEREQLTEKVVQDFHAERLWAAIAQAAAVTGINLSDVRRIMQLRVDEAIVAELQNLDWPGPDVLWTHSLREQAAAMVRERVASVVGRLFDQLTGGMGS